MRHYYVLKNGLLAREREITVHPRDRGLLYGFALFETMLVQANRVVMLRQHLERLSGSAAALGININADINLLAACCLGAVEETGTVDGVLRLTVTAGPEESGEGIMLFSVSDGVPYPPGRYEKGFSLCTLNFPRQEKSPLVRHKTNNYLENLLGRQEALRRGFDEGLFLNSRGNVAEGTVSNIFIVQENELLTPPPDAGLLPGTVRQHIIEHAPVTGYRCRETNFTIDDIKTARECFLTNALMGVMPVTRLDGKSIGNGTPGRVTMELLELFKKTCLEVYPEGLPGKNS